MNTYQEYIQWIEDAGIPTLGVLAWYGVSDSAMVDCNELTKAIEDNGAPMRPPATPKMADVFRRACNAAERKKVPTNVPQECVNYNLEDVGHDETSVYRMIVAERVDSKERRIGYKVLAKAIFDREDHSVTFEPQPDEHTGDLPDLTADPTYASVCQEIVQFIETRGTLLSTIQIRYSLTNAFEKTLKGIPVKSSLYFVGNEFAAGVGAMEAVANCFDGVSVGYVPLPDHEKHRVELKEAFEDESIGEAQKLLAELKTLNTQQTVSAKKFTDVKVRYEELKARVNQYKEILGDNLSNSETTLQIADAMMVSVLEKSLK